ncbi:hypothetical protein ACQEU3_04765 [Spirillospora sp. CA-253888]
MKWRKKAAAALSAVGLGLSGMVAVATPASAAPLDLSNFQLRPNAYGEDLQRRADDIPMVKASVTDIMNNLNRTRKDDTTNPGPAVLDGAACNPNGIDPAKAPKIVRSICFNNGDAETEEWFPQGVTTVADMQGDQKWGDSPQQILVSWYDKDTTEGVKGVRISFVSRATGAYRHVLLVYPQNSANGVTYESVRTSQDPATGKPFNTSLHAGGILWYGNYLFVADTARGFRVFDMRRIYDLGASGNGNATDATRLGLEGDTYYAKGYRYVMPQVGSWTRTNSSGEGSDPTCTMRDGSPQFSYVSLDRSGTNDLIAGEWCTGTEDTNGRVAVWPMARAFKANGDLVMDPDYRWNAEAAYWLPESNVQGATRFKGRWYLSRSDGITRPGWLTITKPVTSSTGTLEADTRKPLGYGPEDLSHWPGGGETTPTLGEMWTVGEHPGQDSAGNGPSRRMLYAVSP